MYIQIKCHESVSNIKRRRKNRLILTICPNKDVAVLSLPGHKLALFLSLEVQTNESIFLLSFSDEIFGGTPDPPFLEAREKRKEKEQS